MYSLEPPPPSCCCCWPCCEEWPWWYWWLVPESVWQKGAFFVLILYLVGGCTTCPFFSPGGGANWTRRPPSRRRLLLPWAWIPWRPSSQPEEKQHVCVNSTDGTRAGKKRCGETHKKNGINVVSFLRLRAAGLVCKGRDAVYLVHCTK